MRKLWSPLLLLLALHASGFRLGPVSGVRVHRPLLGLFDDSIDVSPERNGQVLKRIVRKGDMTKGRPVAGDTVYICWKIFDEHGTLLHETTPVSSDAQTSASAFAAADQMAATDLPTAEPRVISEADAEPEDFNFCLGATPRQVIRGWEAAVPTMYEGEVAVLSLRPEWAFGAAGVPQLGVMPNAPLSTHVELIKIVPSPLRTLETVGPDESIREELMRKIERGDGPVASAVQRDAGGGARATVRVGPSARASQAGPPRELAADEEYVVTHIDVPVPADAESLGPPRRAPAAPSSERTVAQPGSTSTSGSSGSSGNGSGNGSGMGGGYITGVGRGHSWAEDGGSIDVEVPVPASHGQPSKAHVQVLIEKTRLRVLLRAPSQEGQEGQEGDVQVLLDGPLFGAVRPSQSSWALLPPDARAAYRGHRVQVSLSKAHGWTHIWASLLDRAFLEAGAGKQA